MKNSGTALLDGDCVVMDTAATGSDLGNTVKESGTGGAELIVVGFAYGAIAAGAYGKILVYGVHPGVSVHSDVSAAGIKLKTHTTAGMVAAGGADDPSARLGFSLAAGAGSPALARVFVKCM